jgi:arsenate reductase
MERLTIYQKPSCTTCRKVFELLRQSGVDFDAVDYYIDPIPKSKLKVLLGKMGFRAVDLLRKNAPIYKTLGLGTSEHTEDELIDLMSKYPDLIQRPIIEKGKKAILARPPERLREIL